MPRDDIIYTEEVLAIFDGKLTYRTLLNLVREKQIPALKAGKRLLFSRNVVLAWRNKKLGCV